MRKIVTGWAEEKIGDRRRKGQRTWKQINRNYTIWKAETKRSFFFLKQSISDLWDNKWANNTKICFHALLYLETSSSELFILNFFLSFSEDYYCFWHDYQNVSSWIMLFLTIRLDIAFKRSNHSDNRVANTLPA